MDSVKHKDVFLSKCSLSLCSRFSHFPCSEKEVKETDDKGFNCIHMSVSALSVSTEENHHRDELFTVTHYETHMKMSSIIIINQAF